MSDEQPHIALRITVGALVVLTILSAGLLFAVGMVIYVPVDMALRAHRKWYTSSVERARRYIETEARRFGGTVNWE